MEIFTFELMHEEIKRRAYQLIERKQAVMDGRHVEDELRGELPRIVYALSRVQQCGHADMGSDRIHRAARIYLLALSSFVAARCTQKEPSTRVRNAAKN